MTAALDPGWPVQQAVVAALLGSAENVALLARTDRDGPAVFAPGQDFSDVLPRQTIDPPQVLDRTSCVKGSEVYVTVHSWANGAHGTRIAGQLAGTAREALDVKLTLTGHRVLSGDAFQGSRPVGDPDDRVTHIVSTFRYLTEPA